MAIGTLGRNRAGTGWRGNGTIYLALTSAGSSEPGRSDELTSNGFSRLSMTTSAATATGVVSQTGTLTFTATGTVTVSGYMLTTTSSQEASDDLLQAGLLAYGSLTSRTLNTGDTITISNYQLTPQT